MQNSFYQAFDTERIVPEEANGDHRSPFQVDRDRVLYTSAFRKLQSKTQVFLSGEYDFYRTRLTHSLEVAQIGRSITHWLLESSEVLSPEFYIDPDLVEAACLSHDLGHPPFGHAGEKVLNDLMCQSGGFEGNAQTLRLLTERIFAEKGKGMNPTRAFTDSVLKYKSLWSEIGGAEDPPRNHFLYDDQHAILDWTLGGNDFPSEYPAGKVRDSFKSVECQIMDWADDTAYSLNDLADSARAGFLTIFKIEKWAEQQGNLSEVEEQALEALLRALKRGSLDAFVGSRIGKYVRAAQLVERVNFLSGTSERYRYGLEIEEEVNKACDLYKRVSYELVFLDTGLKQLEYKGEKMLRDLWETLTEATAEGSSHALLLPEKVREELRESPESLRVLSDFLSSHTDLSARKLYMRLFHPSAGSITDLMG